MTDSEGEVNSDDGDRKSMMEIDEISRSPRSKVMFEAPPWPGLHHGCSLRRSRGWAPEVVQNVYFSFKKRDGRMPVAVGCGVAVARPEMKWRRAGEHL